MATMEPQMGKMEAQLHEWAVKLDELKAKTEAAGADVKAEYRKHVRDLKSKHRVAKRKLDQLKAAGTDELDTIKTSVEGIWAELETAFKKVTKELS